MTSIVENMRHQPFSFLSLLPKRFAAAAGGGGGRREQPADGLCPASRRGRARPLPPAPVSCVHVQGHNAATSRDYF